MSRFTRTIAGLAGAAAVAAVAVSGAVSPASAQVTIARPHATIGSLTCVDATHSRSVTRLDNSLSNVPVTLDVHATAGTTPATDTYRMLLAHEKAPQVVKLTTGVRRNVSVMFHDNQLATRTLTGLYCATAATVGPGNPDLGGDVPLTLINRSSVAHTLVVTIGANAPLRMVLPAHSTETNSKVPASTAVKVTDGTRTLVKTVTDPNPAY